MSLMMILSFILCASIVLMTVGYQLVNGFRYMIDHSILPAYKWVVEAFDEAFEFLLEPTN